MENLKNSRKPMKNWWKPRKTQENLGKKQRKLKNLSGSLRKLKKFRQIAGCMKTTPEICFICFNFVSTAYKHVFKNLFATCCNVLQKFKIVVVNFTNFPYISESDSSFTFENIIKTKYSMLSLEAPNTCCFTDSDVSCYLDCQSHHSGLLSSF